MPDIISRSLALPYAISMGKCTRLSEGLNMNAVVCKGRHGQKSFLV